MDRTKVIHFRVTDEEYDMIMQKMQQCNIQNLSGYLRKMAIDGMIINLDIPELKEISRLLGYNSCNINQIAKQLNSGSESVCDADFADICDKQERYWKWFAAFISSLANCERDDENQYLDLGGVLRFDGR